MKCPYCGKEAKWTSNEVVYGKKYGKSFMCYWCEGCNDYVGCHNNTTKPLGTMANKELRILRIKCHKLFDKLWNGGKMTRRQAYRYLRKETGVKHIGSSNKEDCSKIIKTLKE